MTPTVDEILNAEIVFWCGLAAALLWARMMTQAYRWLRQARGGE